MVAVLALILGGSLTLRAQPLPLGSRTAAMGGAATAAGNDGAMPYLNPAGFAGVNEHTLALSASLYRYRRVEIQPFFFHGNANSDLGELVDLSPESENRVVSSRVEAFPGAASMIWHFGGQEPGDAHHVLSANVLVLRNTHDVFEGRFAAIFDPGIGEFVFQTSSTYLDRFTDYLLGPGYAVGLGNVHVGAAALFIYTEGAKSITGGDVFASDTEFLTGRQIAFTEVSALGFQPSVGVQWNVAPELHFGAMLAPASTPIASTLVSQSVATTVGPPGVPEATSVTVVRTEGDFERRLPLRVQLGVAWEVPRSYALAGDVIFRAQQDRASVTSAEGTRSSQVQGELPETSPEAFREAAATVERISLRAGAELYLSEAYAVRFGGYYEPARSENELETGDVYAQFVDTYGGTLGIGLSDEIGNTTVGVDAAYATGTSAALDPIGDLSTVQEVDTTSWTVQVFLGGAIEVGKFADWAQAIRDSGQLLELEKRTLTLADLDWSFRRIAAYPEMAPLSDQRVEYVHSGVTEFDRFFEQAARIRLTLQTAPWILTAARNGITSAKQRWNDDDGRLVLTLWRDTLARGPEALSREVRQQTGAESLSRILFAVSRMQAQLAAVASDIAELPQQARVLMNTAEREFSGPNAVRLNAVLGGLSQAESDLRAAISQVPQLVQAYAELFEELRKTPPPAAARPPTPAPSVSAPAAPTPIEDTTPPPGPTR